MRRHAVTEGTRDEILAELERYGSDRAQQGKPEKAAAYAHAVHAVEAGALEVRVEHALYRVAGERLPRQYLTTEESREGVLQMLKRYSDTPDAHRAESIAQAVVAVEHGAVAVFAGGEMYRVVED